MSRESLGVIVHDPVRLVSLSGPDGTGKTTQANVIVNQLSHRGKKARYVWLRFYHLISLPLLAYFRLAHIDQVHVLADGTKMGPYDLRSRPLISQIYGLAVLLDMFLATVAKLKIPSALNYSIVCDRYVLDTLADLSECTGNDSYHLTATGMMFKRLAPRSMKQIVIVANPDTLRRRRNDLAGDPHLEERVLRYRMIAENFGIPLIDAEGLSVDDLALRIESILEDG